MKKNKKRKSFKKVFCESCKELYSSFLSIPIKIRMIVGIWLGIFLILVLLILFTNNNNKKLESYHAIENQMNQAMLKYAVNHSIYTTNDTPFKMSLDALIRYTDLNESSLFDSTCTGYSVLYYNDLREDSKEEEKYRVQSFIHCNSYTTSNYNDYK